MQSKWRNSRQNWGAVARTFHWVIAALILAQFAIGNIAEEMTLSPAKLDLFVWHKSIGVTVLSLVILRALWRLKDTTPDSPADRPGWEARLAAALHGLLYVLMVAVPVSGWVVSDASRVPFKAYFLLHMPDLIGTDRSVQETAAVVHESLTGLLLAVVLLHVAAALRHHFLLKNNVLRRMLTGG